MTAPLLSSTDGTITNLTSTSIDTTDLDVSNSITLDTALITVNDDGHIKFNTRLADYYLKTDDTSGENVTTENLNAANAFVDVIGANVAEIDDLTTIDLTVNFNG